MKQRKVVSMIGMVVALIGMVCMTIACSDMAAPNNSNNDKYETKIVDILDLTGVFFFPSAGANSTYHRCAPYDTSQYYINYKGLDSNSGQQIYDGHKFQAGDKITYKVFLSAKKDPDTKILYTFKGVGENTFKHDFADSITNPEGKGDTLQVTITCTVKNK